MLVTNKLSPNYSKKQRKKNKIKFIIIHYTGMQSEIESIKRLKNIKSKVSCHYLINRKGITRRMVDEKYEAWHAGKSRWKNLVNLNKYSIGIELVNKGHKIRYENFSDIQIKSLIKLCSKLKRKYKIKKQNFLGHSDIAPLRKVDPGEKFPWKQLSKFNIGIWYKTRDLKIFKKTRDENNAKIFFKNLRKIGYRYFNISKRQKSDARIIKAFKSRYLQDDLSIKIDQKTLKISHFLANC